MGFKYEDEELELTYKDKAYKYRAPSALEQKAMAELFSTSDKHASDLYIEFFESLGLPREGVLDKMSMKGLMDLLSYTTGSKKN